MFTIDPALANIVMLSTAAIFGASGAMKLADLEMFEGSVANYRLMPRWSEKPFAHAIPIAECAGAVGVLYAPARAVAAGGLLGLLAMFSVAIAINLARGRINIDCGCFGPALRQELSGWLLGRNLMLAILVALAMAPESAHVMLWIDDVTIAFGAATVVVLYASGNHVLANAPRTQALKIL